MNKNKGYNNYQFKIHIKNTIKTQNKPHFIIENDQYDNSRNIMNKLKKSAQCNKKNTQNNTFIILFPQLKEKVKINIFIRSLKDFLNKQERLEYTKNSNNQLIKKGSI
ncbi:ErpA protein (erpA) [Borrelia duttonii CR2A]|uniref:ErpA protein (ErpA) n=1 Tax=Borrelia duttonii CR2A TaxID=1432657 RepID=W6TFI3_9SPIR|nr:ErpA protein (erpA) [Borrelia duttonii CR2A]